MTTTREALKQLAQEELKIDGGLIYTLRDGINYYEINVTMAAGSRDHGDRSALALDISRLLAANAEEAKPAPEPVAPTILINALQKISRWHGEFPATGQTWESGNPMSYEACYGSNGERDYMRQVALDALASFASLPAPVDAQPVSGALDERQALHKILVSIVPAQMREKHPFDFMLSDEIDRAHHRAEVAGWNNCRKAVMDAADAAYRAALSSNQVDAQPITDNGANAGAFYRRLGLQRKIEGDAQIERDADRQRYPDEQFNKWLDEGISDSGHTVWDQIEDVSSAWHGWENSRLYGTPDVSLINEGDMQPESSAKSLVDLVNDLLHQIDIGDFVDSHGHSAKMLKPVWDLMKHLSAPAQPASGAVDEMEKIAAYPKTRADELSAETMRALARAALSVNQVNAAQPQKFEISPNVDLVELRKHVSHGYTPSSATILDMINFILCHAAQPDDLSSAIERGTKAWAGTPEGWVDDLRGGERPGKDALFDAELAIILGDCNANEMSATEAAKQIKDLFAAQPDKDAELLLENFKFDGKLRLSNPELNEVPVGYLAVKVETLQMIYEAMNHMGDVLNNMDAVEDEDIEKTSPAFDAIRELVAAQPAKSEQRG